MKGRTQRQTMALSRPRFRVSARIVPRKGNESEQPAYDEQFARRAAQGKCFQQPYLGCREFVAFFRYVEQIENEPPAYPLNQNLGLMLYDVFDLERTNDSHARPFITVFPARIVNGVLDVPPFSSEVVRKPERTGV